MKNALIIGASGGIGAALTDAVRDRGDTVTTLSRIEDGLDIADEASVARVFGGVTGSFDMILVATGILAPPGGAPEKAVSAITAQAMAQVFAVNAIGPALILKSALPMIPKDRRVVIGVLSARVGSIGDNRIGGWHSYRASKAALNQIVHGAAIELARTHPQAVCVALHPGTVKTAFTRDYKAKGKVDASAAAANLLAVLDGLTTAQSGGFYDYTGVSVPW